MKKIELSADLARKIIINSQLLDGRTKIPKGKNGTVSIIKKLGYIQIDTLAVVNRSHHLCLWTRDEKYSENLLYDLQAKDRLIFEYWGHAMSYFHIDDFRFFLPKMKNFINPQHKWIKHHLEHSRHLFDHVLNRIKNEGPLSSKDFEVRTGNKKTSWWDWKPSKTALELLFWRGELMISERKNFQKIYDLTERVIPPGHSTKEPDKEELADFVVLRALSALGLAEEKEIMKFMQPGSSRDSDLMFASNSYIKKSIGKFIDSGNILEVRLNGFHNSKYYVLNKTIEKLETDSKSIPGIHFLSPFDNLIIQRDRTKKFFSFDYSIECYLPAAKRKYGYFVMPVLFGDRFIARFDPKADRAKKILYINNFVFESGEKRIEEYAQMFSKKLIEFATFNGCDKIEFKKVTPAKYQSALKRFYCI